MQFLENGLEEQRVFSSFLKSDVRIQMSSIAAILGISDKD